MNTFKKIAAVTLAAATLATTMITASAANKTFTFSTTGKTYGNYYNTTNYINYKDEGLDSWSEYTVKFSSIDKSMIEGNVICSIDFVSLDEDLENIDFLDVNGGIDNFKFVNAVDSSKYALARRTGAYNIQNIFVVPLRDYVNNFDITGVSLGAYYEPNAKYASDTKAWLYIDYKIKGQHIYVGDSDIGLDYARSNRSNRFSFNDVRSQKLETTGTMKYLVNKNDFLGKTRDVEVCDVKVGTITIPKDYYTKATKATYKNL